MKLLWNDRTAAWAQRSRWWLYSCTVLAATALLGITGYQLPWTAEPTTRLAPLSWVLLGVLFVVHLGRRRAPLAALGAAGAVVLVEAVATGRSSLAVCVLAGDLLYGVVAAGRSARLSRWSTTGSTLTLLAVVVAFVGGDLQPGLASVGSLLAVVGVSLWWGRSVRQSREIADQERELLARTADAARLSALVAERLRISRDLHDAVSGQLSAIALLSESALAADRAGTTRPEVLPTIRSSAVAALGEMRSLIEILRGDDGPLTPVPDPAAAVAAARASGLTVDAALPDDLDALPVEIADVVGRGVREALSNAGRHAPGSSVQLRVVLEPHRIRVEITDDGPHRPVDQAARGAGLGLVALTERVAALGGRTGSGPHGTGWRVSFEIPVDATVPGTVTR